MLELNCVFVVYPFNADSLQLACLWPVGMLLNVLFCRDCFIGPEKPLWGVVNEMCIV